MEAGIRVAVQWRWSDMRARIPMGFVRLGHDGASSPLSWNGRWGEGAEGCDAISPDATSIGCIRRLAGTKNRLRLLSRW